ncbi:right-handed parallel beta-helix repeat-containing protein [Dactylosporangium sp. NBC_01737]|uniref:pectate lyase family protein n=1 Tax=Dactylosporangium sp. NBC_01737 TaxID=2975959 RepID=UPI002E0ED8C7|nr:right-handed parallel beta-helix repeat-containing protein [Dactylosporangium sp. NBC_01737]
MHRSLPISRRVAGVAAAATTVAVVVGAAGIAFGAPLFADDFEDGNSNGWSKSGGSWSVVTDGSRALRQAGTSSDARAFAGATTWTDYAVQARVKPISYNGQSIGVIARAQNSSNYYALTLTGGQARLVKRVGGAVSTIATGVASVPAGTWATVRLEVAGGTLRGLVDGGQVVSATDATFASGRLGLLTSYASATFDDVTADTTTGTPSSPPPSSPTPSQSPEPPGECTDPPAVVGFAAVNAWGQNGTTGGCGGPTVTVSDAAAFLAAIARPGPLVIRVSGVITLPGPMHDVTSDKTIVGVGAASGLTGGGLNVGLPVDDAMTAPPANAVHNVIIRNLVFTGTPDDAVNVQMFSHHVWIDHNDLSHGYDGLVDIKRGSSYVTVSWNHTHDHTKNMLLGHDDSNGAQDTGQLKVTYHHNFFDRTPQRNPRVRFGEPVHVFNNYFLHNTDIGVACQASAGCVIENNVFEDTEEAYAIDYAGPKGRIVARGNIFIGESTPGTIGGTVQEPGTYYSYTAQSADAVKAAVLAGAGTGHI